MKNIRFLIIPFMTLIAACATPNDPNYDPSSCGHDGGYARGKNDARADKPMDLKFSKYCMMDEQEETAQGYREGYDSERGGGQPVAGGGSGSNSTTNNSKTININIGGIQKVGSESNPTKAPEKNDKAYFCKVKAFMETFESYGATKLEAQNSAKAKCVEKYHEMHCSKISCQENR